MDLLIRNGTVVSDGTETRADLAVKDGKVAAIGHLEGIEAAEIVDAEGKILLPGLVESGSSLLAENDYWTASRQAPAQMLRDAAAGGVTTIVFPLEPDPAKPWSEQVEATRSTLSGEAAVDFAFHYFVRALDPARLAHLRAALFAGAASVWVARTPRTDPLPATALLRAVLRELPESATAFCAPADPLFEDVLRQELRAADTDGTTSALFPDWAEAAFLRLAADFAGTARGRLVVLGVTSARALRELLQLRGEGAPISAAAALPHLVFNTDEGDTTRDTTTHEEDDDDGHDLPLCWPPLRTRHDQKALWNAVESGLVQLITARHHPLDTAAVAEALRDPTAAPAGTGGIASFLPLLYSEGAAKFRLSLESLSMAACADPAKLLGVYPRKGSLQPGSDADIVLLDPQTPGKVPMGTNGLVNPYTGCDVGCSIESVFLRGTKVDDTPRGQWLDRRVSLG